jgi:hypothetical protein
MEEKGRKNSWGREVKVGHERDKQTDIWIGWKRDRDNDKENEQRKNKDKEIIVIKRKILNEKERTLVC